jgi:hypothetical protein
MDEGEVRLPIGSGPGVLLAEEIRNGAGDHAVLVREGDAPRALLTSELPSTAEDHHRLIVTPLDEEVELRVDGDALAIWLAEGSVGMDATTRAVPAWANAAGFLLLLLLFGFTVLGATTFLGWLLELSAGI